MSKLLLIHNSDHLQSLLTPKFSDRPLFYWYTDRFASHIGTHRYLYICIVDTEDKSIELEYRHTNPNLGDVHKKFLEFKTWKEDNPAQLKYAEPGIVMSSSAIKPSVILETDMSEGMPGHLASLFKVIYPTLTTEASVSLFKQPYIELYYDQPTPFDEITSLIELEPLIKQSLPIVSFDFKEP